MTITEEAAADLGASGVHWDLATLLGEHASVDALLDEADAVADELVAHGRGRIAELRSAVDTTDPANGALVSKVKERATQVSARLLFITLEWAEVPEEHVDAVL